MKYIDETMTFVDVATDAFIVRLIDALLDKKLFTRAEINSILTQAANDVSDQALAGITSAQEAETKQAANLYLLGLRRQGNSDH